MPEVAMSRTIQIEGSASIRGIIRVPGDKSISHRVAMLASIADGVSTIEGFASSADCSSTLEAIKRLGVEIQQRDRSVIIKGKGLRGYSAPSGKVYLDASNSGSTIRMLGGLLAAQPFISIIDGDDSLRRRPMRRIIEPLTLMGCSIEARVGGLPPLTIRGGELKPIDYSSPVASAQVKTCLLFAGLFAKGKTRFDEPAQTRDHTELMLPEFGARFTRSDRETGPVMIVEGGSPLNPVNYSVPGDLSSAAFFIAAATLLRDSNILLKGINLNPTRSAFIDVLGSLGARIERENLRTSHGELVGDLKVTGSSLRSVAGGAQLSGTIIANLVDELPVLAVVATQVQGRVEVRGAGELRVKESDRIRGVVDGIRALGGEIEEYEDGFAVGGPQRLSGGRVETGGDHRIAMAFTVAGLLAEGVTEVSDADCVAVSFPEFYDLMSEVRRPDSISIIGE
jgi:3-phosphoshikimate 1-carboxyvinyltransferase